ncbi:MAG TPA: tetratricopeptide repeat protein [Thermoanaerobaculia bacterium]|nr:tetratricopeptide repeat protein [Thermoanaerobaculia bacterium]
MEQVDWVPALVMLGIGVAIGAVLIWRSSRSARTAAPERIDEILDVRDDQARFDALIVQLRELEDHAAQRTAEQLADERRELELEAARALRALELRGEIPPAQAMKPAVPAESDAREPSAVRGFLWGTVTVVSIAALLFFVTQATSDRGEGDSPTGGTGMESSSTDMMVDVDALKRAVAANPGNRAARLDLARALLIGRDFPGVMEQTEAVLREAPDEPRALSYQAVVRVSRGEADRALEMAQRAVGLGEDNIETWVYLAIVHAQRGETPAAGTVLEKAIERFPNDAPALQSLLSELRGTPPPSAPEPPAPNVPPGGVLVQVQVDPGAGPKSGTVFVFARPASVATGDAAAVRRSSAASFPTNVGLLAADSITGALPDPMRIDARLDADGDPSTVSPGDLVGSVDNVRGGTSVTVVLKAP